MANVRKVWVKISQSKSTELWIKKDPSKIVGQPLEISKISPFSEKYKAQKRKLDKLKIIPISNKIVNGIFFRKCEEKLQLNKRKFGKPLTILISDDQLDEYGWGHEGYSFDAAKQIFKLHDPIALKTSDIKVHHSTIPTDYSIRSTVYFKDNSNDVFIECDFVGGKKAMLLFVYE